VLGQDPVAEAVEVADLQPSRNGWPDGLLNPLAQLARGLDVVGQDEELLREEVVLRFQEPADPLDDDAGLSRPSARNDDQRPIAMLDDGSLLGCQRTLGFWALGGRHGRNGDRCSLP
jgi:hypothetical protein